MNDRSEPVGPFQPSFGIAPPGHRLPADTRPGPVVLQVGDLSRSLAWYERVLGLRAHRPEAGRALLTSTSTSDEETLVELHERPGAAPVPRDGRLGLFHVAILLPDRPSLGAFLRHVAALGEPVGAADHWVSEALYLQDPDGLGVEVYADRPRSTWQVDGRELRMGTVALDAQDLAAAARKPWSAAPAGTTVGHVHLHVGSLEEADAFYHRGLGLDRVVWSYPGALFLSAGGYHHHLGLNTWSRGGAAGPGDAKLLEWRLVLPTAEDVDAAVGSVREAGYEVDAMDEGVLLRDPWGTAVRLTHEEKV
jgi:catechol 2,3-dioxygenase